MTKSRAAANRARLDVANRPASADPARRRLSAGAAHDGVGLELNPGYLGNPEVTIIHRLEQPVFDEPRVSAGDIVIGDRRVKPGDGSLVIAVVGGELVVRRFSASGEQEFLCDGDGSCEMEGGAEILAAIVSVIPITSE